MMFKGMMYPNYFFLDVCSLLYSEYNQALQRLAVMTRGIGDPLVSIYARCYLCRVRAQH